MKTILITMLMLIVLIGTSCEKQTYCWECKIYTGGGVSTTTTCGESKSSIERWKKDMKKHFGASSITCKIQ